MGIIGMRERADLLNGSLEIESGALGGGFGGGDHHDACFLVFLIAHLALLMQAAEVAEAAHALARVWEKAAGRLVEAAADQAEGAIARGSAALNAATAKLRATVWAGAIAVRGAATSRSACGCCA